MRIRTVPGAGVALLLLALAGSGGCDMIMNDWGGDASSMDEVRIGMWDRQIREILGKPVYVNRGSGLQIGWEDWVYETGTVAIYRGRVKEVIRRAPGEPITPRKETALDEIPASWMYPEGVLEPQESEPRR
jgi:hypothetical protein